MLLDTSIYQDMQSLTQVVQAIIASGTVLRIIFILQKSRMEENSLQYACKTAGKVLKAGILAICIPGLIGIIANRYFSNIGTINNMRDKSILLLQDGADVFRILDVGIVIILEISTLIKWQASNEQERPQYKKKAGVILLTGGILLAATGLINTILSYY